MMANLALDNNPALISEKTDDISIDSEADESSNHTEPNGQVTNDDGSKSPSAEEQVEDRIKEDNESHASDNSVMSDDFSFNVQNIIESENNRENTDLEETSRTDSATIGPSE